MAAWPRWKAVVLSRLGWRVATAVFFSILVIEAAILIPSYQGYERDLLARSGDVSRAKLTAAFAMIARPSPRDLLRAGEIVSRTGDIKGGTLYTPEGDPIGSFGEAPALTPAKAQESGVPRLENDDGTRYDFLWRHDQTGLPVTIVARIDTAWMARDLAMFIARVGGLVLIISIVVTGGTLLALGSLVLQPIFEMHRALIGAREDPAHADSFIQTPRRADELGDMAAALNALLQRVSATHREELATLSALVRQAQDGIVVHDASGSLLYANDACLRLCGFATLDEMRRAGQPILRSVPHGSGISLAARLARGPFAMEAFITRPNGEAIPCLVRGNQLESEQGGVLRHFAVLSDISAIRAANDELTKRNAELAAANRAKSDFLANMSHELRTPLNAIIGFAEVMKEGHIGGIENPLYRGYVTDIHRSGLHLLSVINDILDLSKIESGKLSLEKEPTDLAGPIRESLRMMRQKITKRGLEIGVSGLERSPTIEADPRALKQIVLNLLSNAVKFTDPGGRITIDLRRDQGAFAVLRISDTGCGIPESHLPSITKPFVQVAGAFTRDHEGTGLGLSLVHALVEMHGGDLSIESAVGKGTTVTVRFPVLAETRRISA